MANNKPDRRIKLSPTELRETLENSKKHKTIADLAEEHDVCDGTVRKKLRLLRENGDPILFDEEGVFLMKQVETPNDAELVHKYVNWVMKSGRGLTVCLWPAKQLMPGARKMLKEVLTAAELRDAVDTFTRARALLMQAEAEKEAES